MEKPKFISIAYDPNDGSTSDLIALDDRGRLWYLHQKHGEDTKWHPFTKFEFAKEEET